MSQIDWKKEKEKSVTVMYTVRFYTFGLLEDCFDFLLG